jgi:aminopeptidase C
VGNLHSGEAKAKTSSGRKTVYLNLQQERHKFAKDPDLASIGLSATHSLFRSTLLTYNFFNAKVKQC